MPKRVLAPAKKCVCTECGTLTKASLRSGRLHELVGAVDQRNEVAFAHAAALALARRVTDQPVAQSGA